MMPATPCDDGARGFLRRLRCFGWTFGRSDSIHVPEVGISCPRPLMNARLFHHKGLLVLSVGVIFQFTDVTMLQYLWK